MFGQGISHTIHAPPHPLNEFEEDTSTQTVPAPIAPLVFNARVSRRVTPLTERIARTFKKINKFLFSNPPVGGSADYEDFIGEEIETAGDALGDGMNRLYRDEELRYHQNRLDRLRRQTSWRGRGRGITPAF